MTKSDASAVVGPDDPDTEITQTTAVPTRDGLVFVQDKVDDVDGFPLTTKTAEPEVMRLPLVVATMEKELVLDVGVVENMKVAPPS